MLYNDSEVWLPVVGYEGLYQVSNLGNVKSCERIVTMKNGVKRPIPEKLRKLSLRDDGYVQVELWMNNKSKSYNVHRLVAEAFIPNPDNLPEVNHKDCVRSNNNVSNLEWCTNSYNTNYAKELGRLPDNRKLLDSIRTLSNEVTSRKCKCIETGQVFASQAEAARVCNTDPMNVSNSIKTGRTILGLTFERIT